jgi:DNA-binding CsgD family transcriptional regulator
MANARLMAQNTNLQAALDHQRTTAEAWKSILCSIDMATLCVCPALKLRQFTIAAGRLLGIGPEHLGFTLCLSGSFGLDGTLMARIKAVLGSGIAQTQVMILASGQSILCRLLPLRAFGAAALMIDGVVITFATANPAAVEPSTQSLSKGDLVPKPDRDFGKQGLGDPGLGGGLTPRQQQVLDHVLAGHPSKNIAADLGISQRTVENHRAAIMARTGATSLPALVRLSIGADVGGDCKPSPARRLCD